MRVSIKTKKLGIFIIICIGAFIVTSFFGLRKDVVNPDGINWHARSYKFTEALIHKDFENTYQAYHPGVTLMWLTGPALHALGSKFGADGFDTYNKESFLNYDCVAKSIVQVTSLALFVVTLLLLRKLVNFMALLAFSAFTILEPFVLGVRRLYHLDYLMSAFLLVSFLSFFIFCFKEKRSFYYLLGCFAFVLSLLTKSVALLLLPVILAMIAFSHFGLGKKLLLLICLPIVLLSITFLSWPVLWGNPLKTVPPVYENVVSGIIDIGIENRKEIGFSGQSETLLLDESKGSTPWNYYILSTPVLLSPVTLVLLLTFIGSLFYRLKKKKITRFEIFSLISMIIIMCGISYGDKKGLRYAVIFFPYIFILVSTFLSRATTKVFFAITIALVLSLVPQYINIYPYFYVYGNPLLGGVSTRTQMFEPSSFGVASYEASEYIKGAVGKDIKFTLSASKSFKYTLPNAKVKSWPNCESDFAVVYALDKKPNEACPGVYKKFKDVKIGNLEYWTIYQNLNSSLDT